MRIDSQYAPSLQTSALPSLPWDYHVAKWISRVFSPPLLVVIGITLTAFKLGSINAWLWTGFYLLMGILIPVLYIVWKIRQGEISDFHIKIRKQRIRPMILMLLTSLIAWMVMLLGSAPFALTVFAGAGVIQVAFLLLVTLRWKISGHSTAAAGFAIFLFTLFGDPATPVLLIIPIVAWARVRRNRHKLNQTIAGSLAGIVFMVIVLHVVNLHGAGISP